MAEQSRRFSGGQLVVLALALIVPAVATYRYGTRLPSASAVNMATNGDARGRLERTSISGLFVNASVQRLDGVRPGSTPVARFELIDFAGRAIKLDGVSVSCGCMTPYLSASVIPPKGRATIDIKINPSGLSGTTFEKQATVFFGERDQGKSLDLHIVGTLDMSGQFSAIPATVDFGNVSLGGPVPPSRLLYFVASEELLSALPAELDINDVSHPTITIAQPLSSSEALDSRAVRIKLTMPASHATDDFESELLIKLSGAVPAREIHVPIRARVSGRLFSTPSAILLLASTKDADGPAVSLVLHSLDSRPARLLSAKSDLPLYFHPRSSEPFLAATTLDVGTLAGKSPPNGASGFLKLVIDDGSAVTVPVVLVAANSPQ